MDTSEKVCDRLKNYKKTGKELEEVRSTRKLLDGIMLRRDEREKEVCGRDCRACVHCIYVELAEHDIPLVLYPLPDNNATEHHTPLAHPSASYPVN